MIWTRPERRCERTWRVCSLTGVVVVIVVASPCIPRTASNASFKTRIFVRLHKLSLPYSVLVSINIIQSTESRRCKRFTFNLCRALKHFNALLLCRWMSGKCCDDRVCLSVCLSVVYLENHTAELHPISCSCWLGPLLSALRYVIYFRFCGWHWHHMIFSHNERREHSLTAKNTASTSIDFVQRKFHLFCFEIRYN